MRKFHHIGLDVLGAEPETSQALLIRVRNAGELARTQGKLATIAQKLAPATIESKVYESIANELRNALAAKHVEADISVVEPKAYQPADGKHVAQDVTVGVMAAGGVVAVLAILWKAFSRKHK